MNNTIVSQNDMLSKDSGIFISGESGIGSGGGSSVIVDSTRSDASTTTRDGYTPRSERDNTPDTDFTGQRQGSGTGTDTDTSGTSDMTGLDRGGRGILPVDSPIFDGDGLPAFWSPNPDASPEANIYGLQAYLQALFTNMISLRGGDTGFYQYLGTLERTYDAISRSRELQNFSDEASLQLAEKVSDQIFTYINAQFQSALSYQSWYLQQEYNSPINQVTRLAQAGLSSSFIFGGLSSGNAQSSAQVPQIQQPAHSNAGQVEAQAQANKQNFLSSMLGNVINLASVGMGGYKTLLEASAIKKLTPLQLANAGLELLNNAATYERLLTENQERKQGMQVQAQQIEMQKSQSMLDSASQDLNQSRDNLNQFFDKNRVLVTDTVFSTTVTDRYGNRVKKTYDQNGLDYINNHYGKDREGNTVIDEKYYKRKHDVGAKASAGFGIPGVGDVDSEFQYGFSFESQNKNSNSKSSEKETGDSTTSNNKFSHQDGTDSTSGWKIGDTYFEQEVRQRYMLKPEAQLEYDRLQDIYDRALRTYNSQSYKHKQMILRLHHCQTENYVNLSKSNVLESAYKTVNRILSPQTMQGD